MVASRPSRESPTFLDDGKSNLEDGRPLVDGSSVALLNVGRLANANGGEMAGSTVVYTLAVVSSVKASVGVEGSESSRVMIMAIVNSLG